MRIGAAVITFAVLASCSGHKADLDETLEWMDNTYNSHEKVAGAGGHGRMGWYSKDGAGKDVKMSGLNERFEFKDCDWIVRLSDDLDTQEANTMQLEDTFRFNLRDVDPASMKVVAHARYGDFACDALSDEEMKQRGVVCDHAELTFGTHNNAGLIAHESRTVYVLLGGANHEKVLKSNGTTAYFEFDDVEYASRFAKAFAHAVELCGGKPSKF